MDNKKSKKAYPALDSLFQAYFPFLENYSIRAFQSVEDFDYSPLNSGRLDYIKMTAYKEKSFCFLYSSPQSELENYLHRNETKLEKELSSRFYHFIRDPRMKLSFNRTGEKDLNHPGMEWRRDKFVFALKGKKPDDRIWMIFNYPMIKALMRGMGLEGYLSGDNNSPRYTEEAFTKLEHALENGRNLFYFDMYRVLRLLSPDDISRLLITLFQSAYVEPAHIASLMILRKDLVDLKYSLSTVNARKVEQYREVIGPILADEELSSRWSAQLEYYLVHVFTKTIYYDRNWELPPDFQSVSLNKLLTDIRDIRLQKRGKRASLEGLIERLIAEGGGGRLTSAETKGLLADFAAYRGSRFLEDLYRQFSGVFRTETEDIISKRKRIYKKLTVEERKLFHCDTEERLYGFLEKELIQNRIKKKTETGLQWLWELLREMDWKDRLFLYYELGFEEYSSLFELLRYHPDSPLSQKKAIRFFEEMTKEFPNIEKNVCRDIFYEEMNRGRAINEARLENGWKSIRHKLLFYRDCGYV